MTKATEKEKNEVML